jgi:hypothetical protein
MIVFAVTYCAFGLIVKLGYYLNLYGTKQTHVPVLGHKMPDA